MFRGKTISKEIIERKRLLNVPLPEDIIVKVAEAFGIEKSLLTERNDRGNTARKTAIYLVQKYCNIRNEETGRMFGEIHCSAVSKAAARFKEELANNRKLAKIVEIVESFVNSLLKNSSKKHLTLTRQSDRQLHLQS